MRAGLSKRKTGLIALLATTSGYTLIETIIYIALLSLILTGSLTIVHRLTTSNNQINQKIIAEGEAAFIFRKLEWALNGSTMNAPALNSTSTILTVTKSADSLEFKLTGKDLTISRNSGSPVALNSKQISLNFLEFSQSTSGTSKLFEANLKINDQDFKLKKYLHE